MLGMPAICMFDEEDSYLFMMLVVTVLPAQTVSVVHSIDFYDFTADFFFEE